MAELVPLPLADGADHVSRRPLNRSLALLTRLPLKTPPLRFAVLLAYFPSGARTRTKQVYAYISYALLMTAYTAVNILCSALAGTMTSDKD